MARNEARENCSIARTEIPHRFEVAERALEIRPRANAPPAPVSTTACTACVRAHLAERRAERRQELGSKRICGVAARFHREGGRQRGPHVRPSNTDSIGKRLLALAAEGQKAR